MKILVLSDDFPPEVAGGAGLMAFRITKEFARQGHEVLVLTTTTDIAKQGSWHIEGIPVRSFYSSYHERWRSYRSLWNPVILEKVKKALSEFKPDVVHAHNIHAHLSYASLVVVRKYTPRIYMTAHDIMSFYPGTFTEFIDRKNLSCPDVFDYRVTPSMLWKKFRFRYNPVRNTIIKICLRRVCVIAVSNALKEALVQNGIRVSAVIRNGIDVPAWTTPSDEGAFFKRSLQCESSDLVLFGGRLSGAKGGDLILQAMKEVVARAPLAKLLVVGRKDHYAKRMEKKAESFGLSNTVIFSGWLSENEMKKAYAASTLAVIPSVCFDSFPNGNLEAFAAGKPVVATCFGGSREIVHDGENGYIVNPFHVSSMANAITDLILDKEKARRFGEAGRRLVSQEYSIETICKNYISFFALNL